MLTSQEVSMPKSVDVTEYAFVQTRLEVRTLINYKILYILYVALYYFIFQFIIQIVKKEMEIKIGNPSPNFISWFKKLCQLLNHLQFQILIVKTKKDSFVNKKIYFEFY